MKLDVFIEDNLDEIVDQFEAFARTLLPAAQTLSGLALRNDSRQILQAVVADMRTRQTETERSAKSTEAPAALGAPQTLAAAHGALRHAAGFDIAQVVSEYRALRAGVLALWRRTVSTRSRAPAIEEIARFNEAIDQALAESVQRYSSAVAASRDLFLAVLGHDLRSPLQGIEMASSVLALPTVSDSVRLQTALRVKRASKTMGRLIADLLEYTRSRLGSGITIERSACDLRQVCEEAIDAVKAIAPDQEIVQHLSGDLQLWADCARLQRLLSNLLNNAVQHGDQGAPVALGARGEEDGVVMTVANAGKPIPAEALRDIFEPLVQVPASTSDPDRRPKSNAGLGLFIAREIVLGHDGTIDVQSSAEAGTVFTIRLPRAQGPRG
jgi:signal transduction histidine kinase